MRNPWICILIVGWLGLGATIGTAGIVTLGAYGKEIPSALVALVSACYGSLSSFLVMPPRGSVGGGDQSTGKP